MNSFIQDTAHYGPGLDLKRVQESEPMSPASGLGLMRVNPESNPQVQTGHVEPV
jgi:hypothetical protein